MSEPEMVYRALFEAAPVALLRGDRQGRVVEANACAAAMLGVEVEALVGREFFDFTHPDEVEHNREMRRRFVDQKLSRLVMQTRWVRADGASIDVELTITAVRDPDGELLLGFITAVDITARRAVERALEARAARSRSFFEDHSSVMLLLDPESGHIVDANQAAADFYGWSKDTLRTMRIEDINQLPRVQVMAELDKAWHRSRSLFYFPHRIASGEVREVEVHSSHFERDGRVLVHSIIRDITEYAAAQRELTRREAQLRRTEAIVDVGGWELGPGGGGLLVSMGFRRIFGLPDDMAVPADYIVGRVEREQRGPFSVLWHRAKAQCEPASGRVGEALDVEVPLVPIAPMQRVAWVRIRAEVVVEGDRCRLVGAVVDVTARRRVEEEREAALHAVEAAATARAEFLATMSHEIRTPMNGVLGMAEALSNTRLDAAQTEMLETVKSSGAALMRVIDDVLDLSKIEAGRLQITEGPVELSRLGRAIERLFAKSAEDTGTTLCAHVDPGLPAAIVADGDRLHQVLANFVSNAIKFTAEGRVDIEIVAAGEGRVRFEVRDTGVGIPKDALPTLFQRFMQVGSQRRGSTGLGLAICQRLVRAMGGEILVQSEEGKGSCFSFEIDAKPAPSTQRSLSNPAAAPAQSLDVLVADDHPVNRRVVEHMLQRAGHRVTLVEDGSQAVEAWRAHPWDIILMDVYMPSMDGLEATRVIRTEEAKGARARTRVFALTASALPTERAACEAAGMDGFLTKPIRKVDLLEAVALQSGD